MDLGFLFHLIFSIYALVWSGIECQQKEFYEHEVCFLFFNLFVCQIGWCIYLSIFCRCRRSHPIEYRKHWTHHCMNCQNRLKLHTLTICQYNDSLLWELMVSNAIYLWIEFCAIIQSNALQSLYWTQWNWIKRKKHPTFLL